MINDIPAYVKAVAKVEQPKKAADYADELTKLIDTYDLRDYDVVPFSLVLGSGDSGANVTAAVPAGRNRLHRGNHRQVRLGDGLGGEEVPEGQGARIRR